MTTSSATLSDRSARNPVLAAAPHRIAKVTLVVRDLDRVAAFYRDIVGLRETGDEPGTRRLGTDSATLVELRHDPSARVRSPREAGLFHTAFLLEERAELGRWLSFASKRGVAIEGASDHRVSEAIYLSDPEGNGIEIYCDRSSAAWTWTEGTVAMSTDALNAKDLLQTAEGHEWSGFPGTGSVGHVHLQVGAIAPAEAFYNGVLGFDTTARYPGGSFFGSGGYHHQLAANIWNSRGAMPRSEPSAGLADVEMVVAKDLLEIVRARARAAERLDATEPNRIVLRDPWNTRITLASA